MRRGDAREHTFWDTMRNTIETRASSVYVIIDEAHRGMAESARQRREAETIVQRFIKGHQDEGGGGMPPVPIVIGVSATPKRFDVLLSGTDRVVRPCRVPAEQVRRSGLLKETIRLWRGSSPTDSDMTLLRSSVRQLLRYERAWKALRSDDGAPSAEAVRPIMLVQVEDAPSGASKRRKRDEASATPLGEVYGIVAEELGSGQGVPTGVFAHAFEDKGPLTVAGNAVRRLAPAEIDDDPDVRVVFFKSALNTGWDCPRAEVMMSFRSAKDVTNIAQLVGRMVRTPLTRRVDGPDSDLLNGVDLYLPRYDEDALDVVVKSLTDPDEDTAVPAKVVKTVDLGLNPQVAEASACRELLERVPTFEMPKRRSMGEVSRLMAVARRLERRSGAQPILLDASEHAEARMVRCMLDRLDESDRSPGSPFGVALEAAERVVLSGQEVSTSAIIGEDPGGDSAARGLEGHVERVADSDLRRRIERADRELGEGLASAFVRTRSSDLAAAGDAGEARRRARLELLALVDTVENLEDRLEAAAAETVKEWAQTYEQEIGAISDAERDALQALLASDGHARMKDLPQSVPEQIFRPREKGGQPWPRHLYSTPDGTYETKLNGWEQAVLNEELERGDVAAWLRNRRGDPWRLAIPYRVGEQTHLMYPDFVIFRRCDGALVADIVDPHGLHLQDNVGKAHGLADYAESHQGACIGRVEAVAVVDGAMRRRDLTDQSARDSVRQCLSGTNLRLWIEGDSRAPGAGVDYESPQSRADTGDSGGAADYADYI